MKSVRLICMLVFALITNANSMKLEKVFSISSQSRVFVREYAISTHPKTTILQFASVEEPHFYFEGRIFKEINLCSYKGMKLGAHLHVTPDLSSEEITKRLTDAFIGGFSIRLYDISREKYLQKYRSSVCLTIL